MDWKEYDFRIKASCPSCGAEVDSSAKSCPKCGHQLKGEPPAGGGEKKHISVKRIGEPPAGGGEKKHISVKRIGEVIIPILIIMALSVVWTTVCTESEESDDLWVEVDSYVGCVVTGTAKHVKGDYTAKHVRVRIECQTLPTLKDVGHSDWVNLQDLKKGQSVSFTVTLPADLCPKCDYAEPHIQWKE